MTQPPSIGQDAAAPPSAAARDPVVSLLRLEGAAALAGAVAAYGAMDGNWWLFGGLFLLPDLAMLGYLAGPRWGAASYNAAHTYLAPAALALFAGSQGMPALLGPALIWAAHIGFDRLLGYGLKYRTAFGATHLGWRGRRAAGGSGA